MYINLFAQEIYLQNKKVGWWDDPNRCVFECLQLISSEIGEATDGYRKDLMDKHLPHRKSEEVEYADTLIRLLDFGTHHGLMYQDHDGKYDPLIDREGISIVGQQFALNKPIFILCEYWENPDRIPIEAVHMVYSVGINTILEIGKRRGFDILAAAREKHDYNKTRADHKRENRAKEGGLKA